MSIDNQTIVQASTILILILTFVLAYYLTINYRKSKAKSLLFWSLGLWFFVFGVALEIIFAFGVYGEFLIKLYLFVVALLVEFLALGSIQLIERAWLKLTYYYLAILAAVLVLWSLLSTTIGNILESYVVAGAPPLSVIITSSIATFPAAIVIIWVAAASYIKKRNKKMLSIIAGVIVVSIAGTLYIASFPAFLYYSEFFGILLLWLGFFDFGRFMHKDKTGRAGA